MKVSSFPSLAAALAAAALTQGALAQDAPCEGACPAAAAAAATASVTTLDDDAADVLAAKPLPGFARVVRSAPPADDPPRLGVYIDETDVGLRVDRVIEGSLAEAAGVLAGDVLYRINGRSIAGVDDVADSLSQLAPGGEVSLTVIREGEGIVGLSTSLPAPKRAPRPDALADGFKGGFLGVTLGEAEGDGVSVVSIVPSSSAWYAGIEAGDTIVSIDGEAVADPDDVVGAISSREAGAFVDVGLLRGGERTSVRARLGQRGPTGAFGLLQRPGGGAPGLRWLEPDADGMFFFDDDDTFEFEFSDEFGLGDALRFDGRDGADPKGRVFRWKGDLGDLLRGGPGDGDEDVMRLRKRGPGGDGSSVRIEIDGDQVTIERDGETETMSLDEFEGVDGLDVKMLGGDSVLEWVEKHAGPNRKIDIDVHREEHEVKKERKQRQKQKKQPLGDSDV